MATPDYEPILAELIRSSSRDERLSQFHSPVTGHQYVRMYRLTNRYVPAGGRVLDWGTGSGHFSVFLARNGYCADAFSLQEAPRICDDLPAGRYAFSAGDPNDPVSLPYEDETFDAVASVGVLEHVRETGGNEDDSLREICRVLKPGGFFLCFHFPNQYSWIDAAARSLGRWSHTYRYTASDIRALAARAQLELVDVTRYAVLPRNVWSWGVPRGLGASFGLARFYDRVDDALSMVLAPVCQNFLFIARKPR